MFEIMVSGKFPVVVDGVQEQAYLRYMEAANAGVSREAFAAANPDDWRHVCAVDRQVTQAIVEHSAYPEVRVHARHWLDAEEV